MEMFEVTELILDQIINKYLTGTFRQRTEIQRSNTRVFFSPTDVETRQQTLVRQTTAETRSARLTRSTEILEVHAKPNLTGFGRQQRRKLPKICFEIFFVCVQTGKRTLDKGAMERREWVQNP